jgi:hypothetical protein
MNQEDNMTTRTKRAGEILHDFDKKVLVKFFPKMKFEDAVNLVNELIQLILEIDPEAFEYFLQDKIGEGLTFDEKKKKYTITKKEQVK